MINELHSITSILDLEDRHIQFIKKKMQAFIVDVNEKQIVTCMNQLHVDATICSAGLTEQIVQVLNIIIYIIGFPVKLDDVTNKQNKDKLIYIIDELGELLPQMFQKIIKLSKIFELQHSSGKVSNKTQILQELYNKVFKPPKQSLNIDLGLDKLMSDDDTSDNEFIRTVIMGAITMGIFKFF